MVAGALERRVWTKIGPEILYPNLWILLVGPPGVGKGQSIFPIEKLLWATQNIGMAPDNVNHASLFDAMLAHKRVALVNNITPIEYHSLYVPAKEFGVFFPDYDRMYMQILNNIFDNPPQISVQRVHRGKDELVVTRPMLNILGGTTPSFLAETLPESAWSGGFTARFMMIYCHAGPEHELFQDNVEDQIQEKQLVAQLTKLSNLVGHMVWEPQAAESLKLWYRDKTKEVPTHARLEHYLNRRHMTLAKLAVICGISRTGELVIMQQDFDRALGLLLEAEAKIPDIFRAMVGRSDVMVVQELHLQMYQLYANQPAGKRKSIPASMLWRFLGMRMPSEKIQSIVDLALRSDIIAQAADGGYVPRPKLSLWQIDA